VEGRRAVAELLGAGRRPVRRVFMAQDAEPSAGLDAVERLARRHRVPIDYVARGRLAALARTEAPQGVVAQAEALAPVALADLAAPWSGRQPLVLVAAGVTDPHNLGALLRSFECAGATGVVLARHRSALVTPTVAKVAAGAIEHLRFALVPGIPAALSELGRLGVWRVGLAGDARRSLFDLAISEEPLALVVGAEGRGLAPLVARRCDDTVAIPQHGALPSLNVAAAGAVAAFEVARQRGAGRGGPGGGVTARQ
jgi:23S rRNA (guanosine2251-2'-O)-methyltransferase